MSKSKRKSQAVSSASSRPSKSDGSTDFVRIALAYAYEAVGDTKGERFGVWVRKAAKRFLFDLERASNSPSFDICPYTFSAGHANRACSFIECMPHVEGKWDTKNIVMDPSHVFFVVNLFGFRDARGFRRFTSALFCVARKNAKSTLAAAIMNYCLCFEDEEGAQLISAATTGSQARIVFNVAKRQIEKAGADFADEYEVETYANSIFREENGAVFKPINAKASTQDGLNPSHVSLDEIHAHKTHDLVNVIRSAAGARECPLYLYTTTEGFESPGPWAEERAFAESILNGTVEADHYLAVIYALDDEHVDEKGRKVPADDDFDESKYVKANPLIYANPLLMSEIRKLAIEAKGKPGSLSEFRIKRLNRRASSAKSWVNLPKWRQAANLETVDLKRLIAEADECWCSFDLASTTDMASWRGLWNLHGRFYTWGRFWVPEDAVKQRTERKSVNYAGWVESGLVTLCSGATNDFDLIEQTILDDIEAWQPKITAYDPWNATQFVNNLIADGVELATPDDPRGLMQFIQGPKSYTPAMQLCEQAYLNGNCVHGGDPVLTWHMSNVVATHDANMNQRPNKLKSPDKIDGAVTLFMCFGGAALTMGDEDAFSEPAVMA